MTPLRFVAFQDGDLWVAQCLEYDFCAVAKDLDSLYARALNEAHVERRVSLEVRGREFKGIAPAPPEFLDMWEAASETVSSSGPFRLPPVSLDP